MSSTRRTGRPSAPGVDNYLAKLPDDQRGTLEKLRETIRASAPGAEQCISYGLPAFRLDWRVLCYFGASPKHCAFYPGSGTAVAAHKNELKDYSTSKGTVRFQPSKPLPTALIRRLVKYRIAENTAQQQHAADALRSSRR
jgi:uncharacterized protein YdhG (YjbR/CyaY superfamily)